MSDAHSHTHSHGQSCVVSRGETEALVDEFVASLRADGFRRTDALVALLRVMIRNHQPYTLAELAEVEDLRERDQATIYRLVMKLKDAGKMRQLNLAGRVSYFQLVLPGHHHDYLRCESCGEVQEVPLPCALAEVERELMHSLGWKGLHHELEFIGLCPACAD